MTSPFQFLDPGPLVDGDLRLVLAHTDYQRDKNYCPAYTFQMRRVPDDAVMGELRLRIGDADGVLRYPCHIGYDVAEPFRGHHYAARSVRLLLPLARRHGLARLWIGCDPANTASRRTCELAGATLCGITTIPPDHRLYAKGQRNLCRYFIDLRS